MTAPAARAAGQPQEAAMIGTVLVILAALIIAVVGCVVIAPAVRWSSAASPSENMEHIKNK
jgi:hypothetical protein